jgi:peptidoglycan-N-acetylglucosamine deacetylase
VNPWPIAAPATAAAVAGIAAWAALSPRAQLFGPTLRRTPRAPTVALTFDDGPNPAVTPQLLALLDRHAARATFFLVGRWARACPELVGEIAARGHTIGNHTETHPNLMLLSTARIEQEIRRCQESIASASRGAAAAVPPKWMRPPFGFRGPQLQGAVSRAGLRGVAMWSLTAYDWKPQPPERLIQRLARVALHGAAPAPTGEIVLLHDGDFRHLGADRGHVLAALDHWLPRWRDAGLEFVTINEVAGEPPGKA